MFDFIVIGKGLMGSAAFRYLSAHSPNTLLIGPNEPADRATHDGVFGAHYDQARLAHIHGRSPVWSALGERSIYKYREIEEQSGIPFYHPVGELYVADEGEESPFHDPDNISATQANFDLDLATLDHGELHKLFPYLSFAAGSQILWESRPAGHINPRALINAQVAIGQKSGGTVVEEMALAINREENCVTVGTESGAAYQARQVLVSAGAFSNGFDLLPEKLALTLKTEFVVFAKVTQAEAERLQDMPVVHYDIKSKRLADIYMIRPILYPDGHYYLKLGANTHLDRELYTTDEMVEWYARGNSDLMLTDLKAALQAIMPDLQVLDWHTDRCVITRTPKGMPLIDTVWPGQLYVAVGGNGSSAFPSDAIGEIAANLVIHDEWQDELDASCFSIL